jgi:hypothetical protein
MPQFATLVTLTAPKRDLCPTRGSSPDSEARFNMCRARSLNPNSQESVEAWIYISEQELASHRLFLLREEITVVSVPHIRLLSHTAPAHDLRLEDALPLTPTHTVTGAAHALCAPAQSKIFSLCPRPSPSKQKTTVLFHVPTIPKKKTQILIMPLP